MSKEWLFFNMRDELLRIDIAQIIYFQADGNYTYIVTADGNKASICMNLSGMENALAERLKEKARVFARIGKSYIINLNYVYHINVLRKRLVLSDESTFSFPLVVSKEALKKLKDIMIKVKI